MKINQEGKNVYGMAYIHVLHYLSLKYLTLEHFGLRLQYS
jgi:hypothetical protein